MGPRAIFGRLLAHYLTRPSHLRTIAPPSNAALLMKYLELGDVLLVEGNHRISTAIKYLTQSTWSHAALCVECDRTGESTRVKFVEADLKAGIRLVELEQFAGFATRICRPIGLSSDDINKVIAYARDHVGDTYDIKNVVDLARFLWPTPPLPHGWRRQLITFGSGEPTKAICSTMIASAFQSIRYPILPIVTKARASESSAGNPEDIQHEMAVMMHIRDHSLFTPRDFDVSPYFQIIKPTIEDHFDYRGVRWTDESD